MRKICINRHINKALKTENVLYRLIVSFFLYLFVSIPSHLAALMKSGAFWTYNRICLKKETVTVLENWMSQQVEHKGVLAFG